MPVLQTGKMTDAVRPSSEDFNHLLQESLNTWTSYLGTGDGKNLLPKHAIDLKSLVSQTPAFLGSGLASADEKISFACEEISTTLLLMNGQSTWRTSKETCNLQSKVIPKQLLLATNRRRTVQLSDHSAFAAWPGVEGLSRCDKGNYLAILYFAWAYILSARWVELLNHSVDHECHMDYTAQNTEAPLPLGDKSIIQIDLGEGVCEDEARWWHTILCSDDGWEATVKYNEHIYLSPWSVSTKGTRLAINSKAAINADAKLPSSETALKYLSRFCSFHRIYAQSSVALAGVLYIPWPSFNRKFISLPFPQRASPLEDQGFVDDASISTPDLFEEHNQLIPKYMTLSSNVWGIRSLLHSTFFNPDIECNLASAWLNPAFAVLNSISHSKMSTAVFLANRHPRLGILWLGAMFTDLATIVLRDIKTGNVAFDLPSSAWTETTQTS